MKTVFESCNIRLKFKIPRNSLELEYDFISAAYKWIRGIYFKEYQNYIKVRNLCSEEVWERYFAWSPDFDDHREMIMLKKATDSFRKKLVSRNKPDFFKKGGMDAAQEVLKRTDSNQ